MITINAFSTILHKGFDILHECFASLPLLRDKRFLLLQSGTQVPYTTDGIWQLIDSIPPDAKTYILSFGELNSFYQDYGALFSVIIESESKGVSEASNAYYKMSDPNHPFTPNGKPPLYNLSIDDILKTEFSYDASRKFSYDSNQDSKLGATKSIEYARQFSSFGETAAILIKIALASFKIEVSLPYIALVQSFRPGPWYRASLLEYAYDNKDNNVWSKGNPITWEKTFGANGNMQRYITDLLIADGFEAVFTSDAKFDGINEKKNLENLINELWTFFKNIMNGGESLDIDFNESNQMNAKIKGEKGNPFIFGMAIQSIEQSIKSTLKESQ